MIFSSPLFLFLFLPILLGGYLVAGRWKNLWLLTASLFFYSWGEPKYILLMVISVIFNYFSGILLERIEKYRKLIVVISCIFNIGLLGIFKYANFFIENINLLFHSSVTVPNIALPIGISFYTFQILSYVIDVYRKEVPAQKNILSLGLYISLFPQLIAGPIVRYSDIEKQINQRSHSVEKFYNGILRFSMGFIKKILIADTVGIIADTVFGADRIGCGYAWLGIIAYTIQIYYDFSGYSDMAIGLGKMIGFDFLENFNYPYISSSIQEFWKRWHISLSTWFKDYVYIPLGGSRNGAIKTYRNLFIIFFLTGLWHGASWNFVVWGLYYAFFLIAERIFLKKLLLKFPAFIRHGYTLLTVMIAWVLFRAETLTHALNYIKALFSFSKVSDVQMIDISNISLFSLILGIVFSFPLLPCISRAYQHNKWFLRFQNVMIFLFLILAILNLVGSGFSSFLYFRF